MWKRCLHLLPLLVTTVLAEGGSSPVGRWKTVDDETGRAKSIVRLFIENNELKGVVDSLIPQPDRPPDPVCEKCTGDRKGKRVRDMTILWGMHKNGSTWESGRVLDPNNGKIYRCKITVAENGKSLTIRGFIGFSLLG